MRNCSVVDCGRTDTGSTGLQEAGKVYDEAKRKVLNDG